ncbi:damage-control phosphatase ARMT1 family protein [Dactylosporangium sp. CS-047395]|uniref:damage-control phosphatase ARMT1 family protein n=1 Tax=Dactylosporangium sp. CS-047395 TaxID=3239936 RepID=UPI003D94EEA4
MPVEPPVIVSSDPRSFPFSVVRERHPKIVERVLAGYPYAPAVRERLERLLQEDVIAPLQEGAHDAELWAGWGAGMIGRASWVDVPFLFAENFFYRRLLEAVDYYGPGAWRGIDPFGPQKRADLPGAAELAELDALQEQPEAAQASGLVRAAVWGNRADLGFGLVAQQHEKVDELLVDDTARLWELTRGGTVIVVADNAGRELLPDLVLIDFLLRTGRAGVVELHVKPAPYFVSDAMTADVLDELGRFPADSAVGGRLRKALQTERLRLYTQSFYCAPLTFHDAPEELADRFAAAELTILKGDLNYRRLVGDRRWPVTTPFAEVSGYFPGPVAALRTLKSDVVAGLGAGVEERLPASWRTSGAFALVQVRG